MPADDDPRGDKGYGHAVRPDAEHQAGPGDLPITPIVPASTGTYGLGADEPLVGPDTDSPLDEGEHEGPIPMGALRALKEHRHGHLFAREHHLRQAVGSGPSEVYLIDDGGHHAMAGRLAAASPDCEYFLVGRITMDDAQSLLDGRRAPGEAFDLAEELALCGVVDVSEVRSANVFDVARYESVDRVPAGYRVGSAPVELAEDLEIDLGE